VIDDVGAGRRAAFVGSANEWHVDGVSPGMLPARSLTDPRRPRPVADHRYTFPVVREILPAPGRPDDDRIW
jgi:hypothetical protein